MDKLNLLPVLNQDKRFEAEFACISFQHVFRDVNAVADAVLKVGLLMEANAGEMK